MKRVVIQASTFCMLAPDVRARMQRTGAAEPRADATVVILLDDDVAEALEALDPDPAKALEVLIVKALRR